MKHLFYKKLSEYEKYKRLKNIWPLYVIGIIIFYWKLNFWIASIITIVLTSLTIKEMIFLRKGR